MRRLERIDDLNEAMLVALRGQQASMWTALPGIIVSFNAVAMTAEVQTTVQVRVTAPDLTTAWVTLPLLVDCPVLFPTGGGFTLTFPVSPGDECLVIFASRCIDSWWQLSGVQKPTEVRMHDLSDGFVLLGPRSQPRVLPAFNNTAVELRTDSGASFLRLEPDGVMTITATSLTINAPTTINGTAAVMGASLTHNAVNVGSTHTHNENDSPGNPTDGPQ